MATKTGEPQGLGHSLRVPAYRALFASTVAASLGGSVSSIAVSWIVYHYTHNALDISLLGLAGFAPSIILGLFAGVVTDRYNRRSIMVSVEAARFALMGALTLTFWWWGFSLPIILLVMVLVNSAGSLFTPASQAIIAALVPKESLEDATGLLSSSNSALGSIGSALGGVLVAELGPTWGLGTNAVTYALSAIFLFQIASQLGAPRHLGATERKSFGKEFTEGMGYVREAKLLPVTFGYLPVNLLSGMVWGFLVVYSAARFGTSALDYGALAVASAAGGAIGALIPGRYPIRRRAGVAMGLGIVLEGSIALVLTFTGNVVVAFVALLVWGLEIGLVNTVYYATIQAVVPRGMLGRVMSIGDFGSFAAIPAGLILGGILIERVGVGTTFLTVGVGLLVCAAILLSLPSFRSFGWERLSSG